MLPKACPLTRAVKNKLLAQFQLFFGEPANYERMGFFTKETEELTLLLQLTF
jgi:hypothetical protein